MRRHILVLAPVVLVMLAGTMERRAVADCPVADRFSFRVERPDHTPATGLQLQVEAGGKAGIRTAADVVSPSGSVLLCIHEAIPGEFVEIRVASESVQVLYPPNRRSPLSHEGSPSIVVCDAKRDCGQLGAAEITALIQKAQVRTQSMSVADKAAFFREWGEYARQLSRETNTDNAQLVAALLRKERQVTAASRASMLLRKFVNQAREVLVRFDRHAERVLAHGDRGELREMNKAYLDYNPVFNELSEGADAYLKETGDYWSSEASAGLRALIDEALEIHRSGIYTLNATSTLINDCLRKQPECPGPDAARAAVQSARKTVRDVTLPRLDRFDRRSTAWLDSLDARLFGDPAAAAGESSMPLPGNR